MSNIDTVKHIYEAFGREDTPVIIDKLDPSIEWDVERCRSVVAAASRRHEYPAFFESLTALSFQRVDAHTFFADGNKVFVLVAFDVKHAMSGKQDTFPYEGHSGSSRMPAGPRSTSI